MLTHLLSIRATLQYGLAAILDGAQVSPLLSETIASLRLQLRDLLLRVFRLLHRATWIGVSTTVTQWAIKIAKLCVEVLDWLLVPRLAWKITVRHCIALLALYFGKVVYQVALVPLFRFLYRVGRPLFINGDYLRQERRLQDKIQNATNYQEWKKAASELDRLQGRYHWKESSQSLHYDWRRIRDDLKRFRELVDSSDVRGIMSFSRSRLLRNLAGINDQRLYSHLRAGTKRLIEEYISEVVRALQLVCIDDSSPGFDDGTDGVDDRARLGSGVSTAEKLSFFNETRHAFGRSALLLSGGATLGLYHIGVCKSLHESHLLPRVLSGSSVGSIICAMVGTRTDEELGELFSLESSVIKLNFFPPNGGSVKRKITRLFTQGVLMDIRILKKCVKANVPPLTFQEAYELSGRIINIVVSPAAGTGNKDSLRLLNYLTAPNVLVWSAALASCAIPGVYAPVELMKKDEKTGKLSPYMEGGAPIKWEDGSVQADLPMQRLSELFNINHFIVSQTNPHVLPWITINPHHCLLNGTLVAMADGSSKACEEVCTGDQLIGHRGQPVRAGKVRRDMPVEQAWVVTHDDGSSYTVSPEHRMTVRCTASPRVSITRHGSSWAIRLSYLSSDITWRSIDLRVPALTNEVENGSDEKDSFAPSSSPADDDDNESLSLPLLSEDEELILMQSATDGTTNPVADVHSQVTFGTATTESARTRLLALTRDHLTHLPRRSYLLCGELGEATPTHLAQQRSSLWGDHVKSPRIAGFKVPLEAVCKNGPTVSAPAIAMQEPGLAQIALGDGRYDTIRADDRASIVYQLHCSMTCDDKLRIGNKSSALRQIELTHETLGIQVDRSAGLVCTEINCDATSTTPHTNDLCAKSIDHALSFGTATIVVFGPSACDQWLAAVPSRVDSGEITNVTVTWQHAVRCMRFERVNSTSSAAKTVTVWLTHHPCDWPFAALVTRAVAIAHGRKLPPLADPFRLPFRSIECVSSRANGSPLLVTDIAIDAADECDKRYALASGVITHNSSHQSFLTSPMAKLIEYLGAQLKSTALNFLHLNMIPVHPSVKYILDQKYLGDITIVPNVAFADYGNLLVNPTADRLRDCVRVSEQSTWRLIPTIRGACEIEFTLDECVRRMRGTLILEELSDAKKFSRQLSSDPRDSGGDGRMVATTSRNLTRSDRCRLPLCLSVCSRVRSWSSDLLAVGRSIPRSTSDDDAVDVCAPCTVPLHSGTLSMRARSQYNLVQPRMARAVTQGACHSPTKMRLRRRDTDPMRHRAIANVVPSSVRAQLNRQHQPEEDDIVSSEEEEDEEDLFHTAEAMVDSDAPGEMELDGLQTAIEGQPLEGEGSETAHEANGQHESPPSAVAPTADGVAALPPAADEPSVLVPTTSPRVRSASVSADPFPRPPRPSRAPSSIQPARVNIFSPPDAPLPSPPRLDWSEPARRIDAALPSPVESSSPGTATSETRPERLPAARPHPSSSSPAVSALARTRPPLRRKSSADHAASPLLGLAHSRSLTPDVSTHHEVQLSESEWRERNSTRLAQLLKTTQTKVHRGVIGPATLPPRNARPLHQTPASDVAVHIPSIIHFRHTPPRRMSAMDLALLDHATDDTSQPAALERGPSSHRHETARTHSHRHQHTHSDESQEEVSSGGVSDASDAAEGSTFGQWFTHASALFGRGFEESHRPAPTMNQPPVAEADATRAAVVPEVSRRTSIGSATSSPAGSPMSVTFAQRVASQQQLVELALPSPVARPRQMSFDAAARATSSPSSASPRVAPLSSHSSPRASSARLMALQQRFKDASSSGQVEPPRIMRAASSGLPRTMSQIELLGDVTTMP